MKTLKAKDQEESRRTGRRRWWVVESPEDFTRFVRVNAAAVVDQDMMTADFTTMYTAFDQQLMVARILQALREAQQYEAGRQPEEVESPKVGPGGWRWDGTGHSMEEVEEMIRFSLSCCFTLNGGVVRRQVQGMPMGWPPAPEACNLAC